MSVIVATGMASDHLWQDLGLWSRQDLSELMARNFPTLAAKANRDMKWKKFLYKQLCEQGRHLSVPRPLLRGLPRLCALLWVRPHSYSPLNGDPSSLWKRRARAVRPLRAELPKSTPGAIRHMAKIKLKTPSSKWTAMK